MDNLFLLLFFISIISLVVGLIKPSIFSKFLGDRATRKGVAKIFGIAAVVFFVLFGITTKPATQTSQTAQENKTSENVAEQTAPTNNEQRPEQKQSQQESVDTNSKQTKTEAPKEDTIPKETEPVAASFGNGTHIVGTDIKAGTYRSQGNRPCYWARLSGFGGQLDDVIANGNNSPEIVTISASDAAFQTSGCGQWVAVENTYPATPAISFSDGTYVVGKHIAPGTYRADGNPDDLCYWARLSNFSHAGIGGVITNGNSPTIVQISSSDKGFTTFGCGNWTKIK